MERRRFHIVLQLLAVATAAVGLLALREFHGPAQTLVVLGALGAAASLGVLSLLTLERQVAATREARQLKTELLSNVSHELRTPLNAILGYAEILDGFPDLPASDRTEMVERILSNTLTLTCSVNNLLEYSSVVAGESAVRPMTVSLGELFDELEPWVGRMIDGKPIAFVWDVDPAVPPLETDRSKLRQMLLNLLSNAVKFTSTGEIRLSAAPAVANGSMAVEIAVSDTGVGMRPSDQIAIFEDFRQVAGSLTRPFGGMGLGLTLVRRLCDLLGGSIAVESAPAMGTRVALRIPSLTNHGLLTGRVAQKTAAA